MAAATASSGFLSFDEEPVLTHHHSRISTPVLSSMLGIIVAIALGLAIAGGNSFKIKAPVLGHPQAGNAPLNPSTENMPMMPSVATTTGNPARTADHSRKPTGQVAPPVQTAEPSKPMAAQAALSAAPAIPPIEQQARPPSPEPVKKRLKQVHRAAQASKASPQGNHQPAISKKPKSVAPSKAPRQQKEPVAVPYTDREPAYTAQVRPSTRTQYARCTKVSGLIRRERCKWQACDGKWGEDGCPAYQHKVTPFIGAMASGNGLRLLTSEAPAANQDHFSLRQHRAMPAYPQQASLHAS